MWVHFNLFFKTFSIVIAVLGSPKMFSGRLSGIEGWVQNLSGEPVSLVVQYKGLRIWYDSDPIVLQIT